MNIEITVEQALLATQAIQSIKDVRVPAKVGYYLGRYQSKLNPITKQYEESRIELVKGKYGVPKEDNKDIFEVPKEKMNDYIKEVAELLAAKESVETNPLKYSDFEGAEVPTDFFINIGPFVTE